MLALAVSSVSRIAVGLGILRRQHNRIVNRIRRHRRPVVVHIDRQHPINEITVGIRHAIVNRKRYVVFAETWRINDRFELRHFVTAGRVRERDLKNRIRITILKNCQLRAGGVEHIGESHRRTSAEQQHRTAAIRTKIITQDTFCIERCRAGIIAAVYTSENSIRQILIIHSNGRINADARQTVRRRRPHLPQAEAPLPAVERFRNEPANWAALPAVATAADLGSTADRPMVSLKFAPDAGRVASPAAGNTDGSVVIGNKLANWMPVNSRPEATSTVRSNRGTPIELKNGSIVTVALLSNRMMSFSPIWTRVIFSFATPARSSLVCCSYPRSMVIAWPSRGLRHLDDTERLFLRILRDAEAGRGGLRNDKRTIHGEHASKTALRCQCGPKHSIIRDPGGGLLIWINPCLRPGCGCNAINP